MLYISVFLHAFCIGAAKIGGFCKFGYYFLCWAYCTLYFNIELEFFMSGHLCRFLLILVCNSKNIRQYVLVFKLASDESVD